MVGARGFEPPAPCSRSRCATRLRYAPTLVLPCKQRGFLTQGEGKSKREDGLPADRGPIETESTGIRRLRRFSQIILRFNICVHLNLNIQTLIQPRNPLKGSGAYAEGKKIRN